MKTLPLIIFILCCCFNTRAQEATSNSNVFIFETFTEGKALLKNKAINQTKFNYDCVKQELHFLSDGENMIMDDNSNIDTLYIGNRKFIPYQNRFLEYIPINNATLLIDYKTKVLPIGKKGAYGVTTQGTAPVLDFDPSKPLDQKSLDNHVYRFNLENKYYLEQDQKRKKFTNTKSFLKLFPKEQAEAISSFMKKEKINMQNPDDVMKAVEFATKGN